MLNVIIVGQLPKYTVFLHGYTHFIHEWVTFRASHHRGFLHETSKGAKGYGGHASFKYNIHVMGFEETPGGLREPQGIIRIESESRLWCELETKTCRRILGYEYARVKSGSPALLPIGLFLFFHSFIIVLLFLTKVHWTQAARLHWLDGQVENSSFLWIANPIASVDAHTHIQAD